MSIELTPETVALTDELIYGQPVLVKKFSRDAIHPTSYVMEYDTGMTRPMTKSEFEAHQEAGKLPVVID